MANSKSKHPWRQYNPPKPAADLVAATRSDRFAVHLATLPREERQRIEAAERAFVLRASSLVSPQQTAARDFVRGMLGVTEHGPTTYGPAA
jgi:hypothetical protein